MAQGVDNKNVILRLEDVIKDKRPKSLRVFALNVGADPSFFSKIMKGEKPLTENIAKGLFEKYGVNEDWLFTGQGPKYKLAEVENEDYRGKYIKVLEENNQLLKKERSELAAKVEDIQASLASALKRQDAGFGLVAELLKRDVHREAKGNPGRVKKILGEILRKAGPDLSPNLKESIAVDGST
ncbi:MAG: hypothetical protein Q8938_20195 [Bacteroidota bacterium]|nr:hypothetical protein [Bacteroidota bacterium]